MKRKLISGGVALVAVVASLIAATGVGFAAETKWVQARLHWTMNLTDLEARKNCELTSSQVAYLPPDSRPEERFTMVAPDWTEQCYGVYGKVQSEVRRDEDGQIEFTVKIQSWGYGTNDVSYPAVITRDPKDPKLARFDIYGGDGFDVNVFGHFTANVKEVDGYEPRMAIKHLNMGRDGVLGHVELEVYRTGQWIYRGNMQNTIGDPRDAKMYCALIQTNGQAILFGISRDPNDTPPLAGGASVEWSKYGTEDSDLKDAFRDGLILEDMPINCAISVDGDGANEVSRGALITKVVELTF